jgi:hypothetical protein
MKTVPDGNLSTIARDDAVWQGYAGMCMTRTGRLVLTYRPAYGHGAARWARLVVRTSDDRGRSWSEPQILAEGSYDTNGIALATGGVYATALRSGAVLLHYHEEPWPDRWPEIAYLRRSDDDGESWSEPARIGNEERTIGDGSILELSDGTLLLCIGPRMKVLRSTDGGQRWGSAVPVLPEGLPPGLGEVCLSELADGRVLVLMRENTYANFPAFGALSEDGGRSWSDPFPTPFVGHWPSSFRLEDGRHIIAYRNVGGRANSVAWCGDLGQLPGFEVSSCRYHNTDPAGSLTDEGLVIDNDGAKGQFTQFFLFPPDRAAADMTLEAELRCLSNAGQACAIGLRGVGWLRIFPDHLDIEHMPGESVSKLDATSWHRYRLELRQRALHIAVDGREVFSRPVIELPPPAHAPCNAFGNKFDYRALPRQTSYPMRVRLPKYVRPTNSGRSIWQSVRLDITGNERLPDYHYEWVAARDGLPDSWQEQNLLELDHCRDAGDWGKPVVACWPDGECFAVDYFGNGAPVGHATLSFLQPDRGHNCYVWGCRFRLEDIPHS